MGWGQVLVLEVKLGLIEKVASRQKGPSFCMADLNAQTSSRSPGTTTAGTIAFNVLNHPHVCHPPVSLRESERVLPSWTYPDDGNSNSATIYWIPSVCQEIY